MAAMLAEERAPSVWRKFRHNRRGYYSFVLLAVLFLVSCFAEVISNDRPIVVFCQGHIFFPILFHYPETAFGGDFQTETDYLDPYFEELLAEHGGYALFPLNRYSYDTINTDLAGAVPSPPTSQNILGTDNRGRDVFARLLYGFRLSLWFGLVLTAIGIAVGIFLGALQGYAAGKIDIIGQRFIEVWGAMPELYLLIIFSSVFKPSILILLVLLSLFSWMGLSDYVRAEFLKGRNLEYVTAARALGVGNLRIIMRHLLPNAMTPVITFLPFRMSASILALTSLDFLGLGVPASTPSLGELLAQGKENIDAWWISLSSFVVLVGMLLLLIFIGEAFREVLDPRKK